MKLSNSQSLDIQESNLNGQLVGHSFKIKPSKQAFKILTDNLYRDKISSIIRELSCNAWDSHVAAGKQNIPFEIHIPSLHEPYFSIRDFGTGLSKEQVEEVYTSYFGSTKTDTNEVIGCFGLGSKTPFCYKEQFSVISYYNGMKTEYLANIDNGFPQLLELVSTETDEPNGLFVSFPVESKDFESFEENIYDFFKYNEISPTFLNGVAGKENKEEAKFTSDKLKFYKCTDRYTYLYAKISLVLYPVTTDFTRDAFERVITKDKHLMDLLQEMSDIFEKANSEEVWYEHFNLSSIFHLVYTAYHKTDGFSKVLEYNIGDLQVSASRESLSLDNETIDNLLKGFAEQWIKLNLSFEKELLASKNYEESVEVFRKYKEVMPYLQKIELTYDMFSIDEESISLKTNFWINFWENYRKDKKYDDHVRMDCYERGYESNIFNYHNTKTSLLNFKIDSDIVIPVLVGKVGFTKIKRLQSGYRRFVYFCIPTKMNAQDFINTVKGLFPTFFKFEDITTEKYEYLKEPIYSKKDSIPRGYNYILPLENFEYAFGEKTTVEVEEIAKDTPTVYYMPFGYSIPKNEKYNFAVACRYLFGIDKLWILKKAQVTEFQDAGITTVDITTEELQRKLKITIDRIADMKVLFHNDQLKDVVDSFKDIFSESLGENEKTFDDFLEKFYKKQEISKLHLNNYSSTHYYRMCKIRDKMEKKLKRMLHKYLTKDLNYKVLLLNFLKNPENFKRYEYVSSTNLYKAFQILPNIKDDLINLIEEKL